MDREKFLKQQEIAEQEAEMVKEAAAASAKVKMEVKKGKSKLNVTKEWSRKLNRIYINIMRNILVFRN